MTLKVVLGYGSSYEWAIQHALDAYNEVEGRKTFHTKDITQTMMRETNRQFSCEIWFTLHQTEAQQQEEEHKFIGSTDISPNDPDWQVKMEAARIAREHVLNELTSLSQEMGEYDTSDNAPVSSQEGTGATEGEN